MTEAHDSEVRESSDGVAAEVVLREKPSPTASSLRKRYKVGSNEYEADFYEEESR